MNQEQVKVRFEDWNLAQQEELASDIRHVADNIDNLTNGLTMTFQQAKRLTEEIQRLTRIANMIVVPEERPKGYR